MYTKMYTTMYSVHIYSIHLNSLYKLRFFSSINPYFWIGFNFMVWDKKLKAVKKSVYTPWDLFNMEGLLGSRGRDHLKVLFKELTVLKDKRGLGQELGAGFSLTPLKNSLSLTIWYASSGYAFVLAVPPPQRVLVSSLVAAVRRWRALGVGGRAGRGGARVGAVRAQLGRAARVGRRGCRGQQGGRWCGRSGQRGFGGG